MTTTNRFTILFLLGFVWATGSVYAQDPDELRLRDYVNPEEIVSIAPDTPFEQAIQILSDFSQEFDDRVIIDRSGYDGTINVTISNMYWRRALQLITRVNNLFVEQDQEAYEIRPVADDSDDSEEEISGRQPTDLPANLHSREVEISAIFFEGNRRTLRELGVDWSAVSSDGRVNVNNIGAARVSDEIFTVDVDFTDDLIPDMDVTALFNALESANQGEILSSPRVKVVEGQEGQIQVGQDISIKQRDIAGNVIDQFIETGTILTVTPLIISEDNIDFIYLSLAAERSSGTPDPVSTVITKQQAESELLLLSGETAVIAGLYETEKNTVRRGIPYLKDLPGWFFGLKYIFGHNSTELIQNELVIVLKAEIVPSLQERAQQHFRSMPEMLEEGRRDITLDREIGSDPRNPAEEDDNNRLSAPEIPMTPEMVEEEKKPDAVNKPGEAVQSKTTASEPPADRDTDPAHYGLRGSENDLIRGSYTIVLYSLSNENRSRIEKSKLEEMGYKVTMWDTELSDGQRTWRTGVGQFPSEKDARSAASRLPEPYQNNYFITRVQ